MKLTRLELWLTLLLVFALPLGVGLYGRFSDDRVCWDAMAAVAHAFDAFHAQPNANLAMIGFVQPPLPALLQLPIVLLVPWLATSGLAANLLGAFCAAAAAALLRGLAAESGLSRGWRGPLVALFALHPLARGPAPGGAPMALLTTLLMGASWAMLRWARTESLRDLIAASLLLSGALITRYEAVFIVIGALIYLAWRTWRQDRSPEKLEGTLITFALPIAYVAGIWIAANWAIMGDPWFFARETFDPRPVSAEAMLTELLRVGLVAFFPVLARVYLQMRGAGRYPATARPVAWMVLTGVLAPGLFPSLFAGLGTDGQWSNLLTPLAMVLAGGFSMLAAVIGDVLHGRGQERPMQGTVMMAAASLGVAIWLLGSGPAFPAPPQQALLGRGALTARASEELRAAELLRATELPADRQHIIAGWPGFAVALYAGRTGEVAVIQAHELPEQVDTLWEGSVLVLLVGDDASAIAPASVDAGLGLSSGLALEERWRAGPWVCYEVVRLFAGPQAEN